MEKGIVFFDEWQDEILNLSNKRAGILIKALCAYRKGDPLPEMDEQTKTVFDKILKSQNRGCSNGKR